MPLSFWVLLVIVYLQLPFWFLSLLANAVWFLLLLATAVSASMFIGHCRFGWFLNLLISFWFLHLLVVIVFWFLRLLTTTILVSAFICYSEFGLWVFLRSLDR